MTQEEKAKLYDELKVKAQELTEDGYIDKLALVDMFPELKESKDERIMKSLKILLQHFCNGYRVPGLDFPVSYKDMLAWLEKQSHVNEFIIFQHENKMCKESEDESVRKDIIWCLKHSGIKESNPINPHVTTTAKDAIAWLEKQGEHSNFLSKIQVGDKVTRNEDGVLVNLSQLKRIAKPAEEQGEQKQELLTKEKALKNSPFVEQKHAEWSEEDKQTFIKSVEALEDFGKFELADWLKEHKNQFLKPQNTWKPSDEQMNALNYVVNLMASSERPTENDLYYNILKSLRQQLKKLMEDKLKDK